MQQKTARAPAGFKFSGSWIFIREKIPPQPPLSIFLPLSWPKSGNRTGIQFRPKISRPKVDWASRWPSLLFIPRGWQAVKFDALWRHEQGLTCKKNWKQIGIVIDQNWLHLFPISICLTNGCHYLRSWPELHFRTVWPRESIFPNGEELWLDKEVYHIQLDDE